MNVTSDSDRRSCLAFLGHKVLPTFTMVTDYIETQGVRRIRLYFAPAQHSYANASTITATIFIGYPNNYTQFIYT